MASIDVKGISISGIGKIKSAINDYIKEITKTNIATSSKNLQAAIKGSGREAEIKKLSQSMVSYVNNLANELNEFNKRLEQVQAAYIHNDSTASSSISDGGKFLNELKGKS